MRNLLLDSVEEVKPRKLWLNWLGGSVLAALWAIASYVAEVGYFTICVVATIVGLLAILILHRAEPYARVDRHHDGGVSGLRRLELDCLG